MTSDACWIKEFPWANSKFDVLVHEAKRCDRSFQRKKLPTQTNKMVSVFTRLMLQGKVRAAMHWLSDKSKETFSILWIQFK